MSCCYQIYQSPLGRLILAGDALALTGLWFEVEVENDVLTAAGLPGPDLPVFRQTRTWLDQYFSGQIPDFPPSPGRRGRPFSVRYGICCVRFPMERRPPMVIVREMAARNPQGRMSAQAVGGAVGEKSDCDTDSLSSRHRIGWQSDWLCRWRG